MGFAYPDHRTSGRGVGNAAFKRASAASAEDLSGERVSLQVFSIVFFDALFLRTLLDDGTGTDRIILSGIHAYYEPEV